MTKTIQLQHASFDDLVFEQRNKEYGAYQLRQEYNRNTLLALLIAIFITGSILAIPYIARFFREHTLKIEDTYIPSTPVDVDNKIDDPVTPPPPKPPTPAVASIASLIPEIGKDDKDSVVTIEDLEAGNPGQFTQDGIEWNGLPPGDENCEGCKVIEDDRNNDKNTIYTWVQQKPEYVGGEAAMFTFLGDHLTYPERAKSIGLSGQVLVDFVVDEYGKVTDVTVLRGVSSELDQEAVRVVKMMPRWKPGKNNGHAVKVRYHLPINFTLSGGH